MLFIHFIKYSTICKRNNTHFYKLCFDIKSSDTCAEGKQFSAVQQLHSNKIRYTITNASSNWYCMSMEVFKKWPTFSLNMIFKQQSKVWRNITNLVWGTISTFLDQLGKFPEMFNTTFFSSTTYDVTITNESTGSDMKCLCPLHKVRQRMVPSAQSQAGSMPYAQSRAECVPGGPMTRKGAF